MKRTEQLQTIYSNHAEELYRFCKFKTRSNEDAEDLVSDSFIKLFEQDEFDSIQNPRAWLYKVARNMIYDNTKKLKADNFEDDVLENFSSTDISVEKASVNQATIEYIESQIHNLDDDTADIIIMRIWDDMKFSDIAEAMSMQIDAVRKRFNRGIKQLKNLVSSEEKMLNIKSISIPFILAGILGISTQPAYAFTAASSATVATAVGSTLGFTFSNMINSNLTSTAATAGTGILATTAAKLIAGSAIVIAGAGVGIGAVAIQSNQPESPQEQNEVENDNSQTRANIYTSEKGVEITLIEPADITNTKCPLNLVVEAPGSWSFEGSFPVELIDSNGDMIDSTFVMTSEEWTTSENVSFETTLSCETSQLTNSTLILRKDNPSGLPEMDDRVEISLNINENAKAKNTTSLIHTCTFPSINLEFKIPEGWACGYVDSNEEILWVNVENPWYDIHFSKLGRGPYCGDGPETTGYTCETFPFVQNGFMNALEYRANGSLGEIFGTFIHSPSNVWDGWWISIRETPNQYEASLVVNSEQSTVLKAFLSSFKTIN